MCNLVGFGGLAAVQRSVAAWPRGVEPGTQVSAAAAASVSVTAAPEWPPSDHERRPRRGRGRGVVIKKISSFIRASGPGRGRAACNLCSGVKNVYEWSSTSGKKISASPDHHSRICIGARTRSARRLTAGTRSKGCFDPSHPYSADFLTFFSALDFSQFFLYS